MKSITKLKDKARQHELKENWQAAIEAYQEVIRADEAREEEEGDLALYNRVGDLYLRMGQSDQAVDYYSQAASKYAEAGLYNNAIALCNKALRYRPEEPRLYRQLGEYSAEQGFLVDARRWYLEYAERQVRAGGMEEAFGALEEFADLSNDPEVREMLAQQLAGHERPEDAALQLKKAYVERLQKGQQEAASAVGAQLMELEPGADLTALEAEAAAAPAPEPAPAEVPVPKEEEEELVIESTSVADIPEEAAAVAEPGGLDIEHTVVEAPETEAPVDEAVSGLEVGFSEQEPAAGPTDGEAEMAGLETFAEAPPAEEEAPEEEAVEEEAVEEAAAEPLPMLDAEGVGVAELPGAGEEEAEPLPLVDEAGEAAADEAAPLPGFDIGEMGEAAAPDAAADEDAAGFDLGALDLSIAGEEGGGEAPAAEEIPAGDVDTSSILDRARELVSRGLSDQALAELRLLLVTRAEVETYRDALGIVDELVRQDPDALAAFQRRVELASRLGERDVLAQNYLDLAECLVRKGAETKAATVYKRVLNVDPDNERARAALGLEEEAEAGEPAYVDLAAFLDEDAVVEAAAGAGGVETADDFANLFSQFKAKVTEDVAVEDAGSHYDLGLAFKEMGLIDEAITEFQTALRGGEERLKVYEELGQCFIMKTQYNVAVKVLNRALELPRQDESELLGVYYHLGLCHEELGERGDAREAYDKIMQLDPSFRDVPERLSRL